MRIYGTVNTRQVYFDNDKDIVELNPKHSQNVYNHSPDGFNWGYGGSGPSQLALAILLVLVDKEQAVKFYQDFKWKFIATLNQNHNFEIEINAIREWLAVKIN